MLQAKGPGHERVRGLLFDFLCVLGVLARQVCAAPGNPAVTGAATLVTALVTALLPGRVVPGNPAAVVVTGAAGVARLLQRGHLPVAARVCRALPDIWFRFTGPGFTGPGRARPPHDGPGMAQEF